MRPGNKTAILVLTMAALIGAAAVLHKTIIMHRQAVETEIPARERLIELGSTVMLGSFRTMAVDYLWLKVDTLKQQHDYAELEGVLQLIAKVQPTDIRTYTFQGWNLSYNIEFDAPNPIEGWRWVKKGIEFAESGARRNPNHPFIWNLYWQIGYIYYHRCGTVQYERAKYFAEQVQKEYGKSQYEMANEWFDKALNAALQPGAEDVNPSQLAIYGWSYFELAKQADRQGDPDNALAYIDKSIEIQQQIVRLFPKYKTAGDEAVLRLVNYRVPIATYAESRGIKDKKQQIEKAEELVQEWAERYAKPTADRWIHDKFEWSVDRLEGLAADEPASAERAILILNSRYALAEDAAGAAKLKKNLVQMFPLNKVRASHSLEDARTVAKAWARIVSMDPGADNLQSAEEAISIFDGIVVGLSEELRQPFLPELGDDWHSLLSVSEKPQEVGMQRVQQAAEMLEKRYREQLGQYQGLLTQAGHASRTGRIPNALAGAIYNELPRIQSSCRTTCGLWEVLLRKLPAFEKYAPTAEVHLRSLASDLEVTANLAEAALPDGSLAREFRSGANGIWRQLHEFKPSDPMYREKASGPSAPSGDSSDQ